MTEKEVKELFNRLSNKATEMLRLTGQLSVDDVEKMIYQELGFPWLIVQPWAVNHGVQFTPIPDKKDRV